MADAQLEGLHLRIVTVEQAPFIIYDETKTGNDRWSGYLIDMWNELVVRIDQNFTYTLYNSPDGRFGGISNGQWNGMIKEILDGNADLALADFTMTSQRYAARRGQLTVLLMCLSAAVTSWTASFENIGLALMVPADQLSSNFWKFLSPFSATLWISLIAVSVGVSVLLWITDRLSPYGWSKQPTRQERLNMSTSMFYAFVVVVVVVCLDRLLTKCTTGYPNSLLASLLLFLGNGNMILGRSWGTRSLQLAYIGFALIAVANYTANLAGT